VLTEGVFEKMKSDWRAHLEGGIRQAATELQAKQGRLARRRNGPGLRTADNEDEQRRGKTAVPIKSIEAKSARSCRKFPPTSRRIARSSASWTTAPR
jgi:hypothetical protein